MKALSNSKDCPNCGGNHKSKPFCVYDNGSYCFSCNYSTFVDTSFTPNKKTNTNKSIDIDVVFVEPSIKLLKKLLEYNITKELAQQYNIKFCDEDSVLYPITPFDSDEWCGYQQRWLLSDTRRIVTKGVIHPSLFVKGNNPSNELVIVEDYLSARRVSESFNTLCLWGTNLKSYDIDPILTRFDIIYIWLDNDIAKKENSGQVAAAEIMSRIIKKAEQLQYKQGFTIINKECINIATNKDPKYYTNTEIKRIIGENYVADGKPEFI